MRQSFARIQKYLRLATPERRGVRQAAFWLLWMRLVVRLAPFERARRLSVRIGQAPPPDPRVTAVQVGRAVERAAKVVPGATCLVQALAAQAILTRAGLRPTLQLGVARPSGKEFEAHAWLELGDIVVVGGREREQFQPLREHRSGLPRAQ